MLAASVRCDPALDWTDVSAALQAALFGAFGYSQRQLGQDVVLSEIIAVAHSVPGVESFSVTAITLIPTTATASTIADSTANLPAPKPGGCLPLPARGRRATSRGGRLPLRRHDRHPHPPAGDALMADDLFSLLPAFDQLRDTEIGGPLQALLGVIGAQIAALEADIAQLYDDWFIETCQDWLVPYFADLVDVALGPAVGASASGALDPLDAASRRSQVANAIRDRRAKGTLAAIERFATDATQWPCRAIEYARLVSVTQSVRHPDLGRGATMAIGDADALDTFGTPFSTAAETADVRRISSHRTRGTHNLPSIGLVAWRLVADGVDHAPADCVNDDNHFTFDALGRDTQLCVLPTPRMPGQQPAGDLDVPTPISRLALDRRLEDYYGQARSFCVYRGRSTVDRAEIIAADLSRWRHRLAPHQVAVDPVLGRIAFPVRDVPETGVFVSYRRLTVGGLGGGQYPRSLAAPAAALYQVSMTGHGGYASVGAAFAAWRADQAAGKAGAEATIEILDDGVYEETLHLELRPGEALEVRAADGHRPVLRPADEDHDRPETLRVVGMRHEEGQPARRTARPRRARGGGRTQAAAEPGPSEDDEASAPQAAAQGPSGPPPDVTFDGVWVARHAVELAGHLGTVTFRHCTLVPAAGSRREGGEVSLRVEAMPCAVRIDFSVIGRLQVISPETGFDPVPLAVADSILDPGRSGQKAIEGAERRPAWVKLSLRRVTVLGGVDVREVDVVADSLIVGHLDSARRQVGSVRFSYVPEGSQTPRRTSCQPDDVLAAVDDAIARGTVPASDRDELRQSEIARVTPRFDSVRFGTPAYGRLITAAPAELTRGAHDEGELGAYHFLWLAYRDSQLQSGLPAYAPIGTDINALFAS